MNRNSLRKAFGALLTFGAIAVCGSAAFADQAPASLEIDRRTQALSETLMSPFCPGRTISSCPSQQARDLRGEIHKLLEQGYTDEDVRNQMMMIYGSEVRGAPEESGLGLVGWWMPAVFVLVGLLLMIFRLRRLKLSGGAIPTAAIVSPEVEARVRKAMLQRDSG